MIKTLISVVGTTAIGKTALAIQLAQHFNTEIISADSRQFFSEMTIGTAVPSVEELAAAPHHFIQHISVKQPYSVGDFERDALHKIQQLHAKHNVVIMVGGSGLYTNAVTQGLHVFPDVDKNIRDRLNKTLETEGLQTLQNQLQQLDEVTFNSIALNNPHRVIRALEVCIGTGKRYSSFINQPKAKRPFKTITIGISADRAVIYNRINTRVDVMMQLGLLNEVKALQNYKSYNALNTVGYKELFNYLNGNHTLDEAVSEIKKNTRRFAKRQLTWYRKDNTIHWFDYNTNSTEIITHIQNLLK